MLHVNMIDKIKKDVIVSFDSEEEQVAFVQWLLTKETEENWKKFKKEIE